MRNKKFYYMIIAVSALLVSCSTPKDIAYFQDSDKIRRYNDINRSEVRIQKDDLLAIMVNSQATEAALPFNLPIANYYVGGESYGQQRVLGYLVDNDGNIDFPILGKLHVEGLTRSSLRDFLKKELISEELLKDPVVTINFMNFKVSVQGEVNRPGTFNITGERVTLLEALSMAGDLTIYGRRDGVKVIREVNGVPQITKVDLQSGADIFKSPCYFLQQNDIVYVEPNNRRVQQSNINQNNNVSIWLSAVSMILTAATVIISVSK